MLNKNYFILALKTFLLVILTVIGVSSGIIIYAVLLVVDPYMRMLGSLKSDIAKNLDDSDFSKRIRTILEWF